MEEGASRDTGPRNVVSHISQATLGLKRKVGGARRLSVVFERSPSILDDSLTGNLPSVQTFFRNCLIYRLPYEYVVLILVKCESSS